MPPVGFRLTHLYYSDLLIRLLTVPVVGNEWVTQMQHMHADLVGPACVNIASNQRIPLSTRVSVELNNLKICVCRFA